MAIATSDSISLNTIKTLNDTANDAKTTAEELEQHFWFQDTGADAGAHITEVTQEEWSDPTDPNYHSGGNTLITSNGMEIRQGMTPLASFLSSGATVGEDADGKTRTEISPSGMQILRKVNGTDIPISNLGYGPGIDAGGGTSDAPYATLGQRLTGSTVGNYSTAEGFNNTASGYASHAEGNGNTASGFASHAEGAMTTASGTASHAEGASTEANYFYAHAEGNSTTASGQASHAEGSVTEASAEASHAEGMSTYAYATASHTEGRDTVARGDYAHAQNHGTRASSEAQTALGKYNIADTADTYAVIVGNGSSNNARSNALTVEWTGDVVAGGDITDGTGNVLSDKVDASALAPVATSGDYADLINTPTLASVATSGDYNDLTNKPTIPTVPTNVSAFNNDAGYIPGVNFTATAGTTKTLAVPNNSAGYIIASGANAQNQNIYIYNVASNGAVTLKAMGTAPNITTATSTRTITITGATYATRYTVVAFYGDLPTVS